MDGKDFGNNYKGRAATAYSRLAKKLKSSLGREVLIKERGLYGVNVDFSA